MSTGVQIDQKEMRWLFTLVLICVILKQPFRTHSLHTKPFRQYKYTKIKSNCHFFIFFRHHWLNGWKWKLTSLDLSTSFLAQSKREITIYIRPSKHDKNDGHKWTLCSLNTYFHEFSSFVVNHCRTVTIPRNLGTPFENKSAETV